MTGTDYGAIFLLIGFLSFVAGVLIDLHMLKKNVGVIKEELAALRKEKRGG